LTIGVRERHVQLTDRIILRLAMKNRASSARCDVSSLTARLHAGASAAFAHVGNRIVRRSAQTD